MNTQATRKAIYDQIEALENTAPTSYDHSVEIMQQIQAMLDQIESN